MEGEGMMLMILALDLSAHSCCIYLIDNQLAAGVATHPPDDEILSARLRHPHGHTQVQLDRRCGLRDTTAHERLRAANIYAARWYAYAAEYVTAVQCADRCLMAHRQHHFTRRECE